MQPKIDQLFALFAAAAGLASSVEAAAPSTSGTKFTIDGETAYFPGSNCYWCSFLTKHADIDSTLDNFVSSGLRIWRVWGFNDVTQVPGDGTVWFQHLSSSGSTINTGENGLQVLDYLVSSAEKRGIKLIIPFVNYWTDYGGMLAYLSAFGGTKQSEWYTNSAAQTQYRKYVSAVVDRYRDSDAIFAWELANEPRCNGCDTDVIQEWATSISKFVKGLDPNHMVSLGDEGFGLEGGDGSYPYQYGEGTNFTEHLTIDTLDFGTFHLYPNSWGTSYEWGSDWVKSHAAACKAAGKPCFFEEYGAPSDHCKIEAPWQKTAIETEGIGGDAFWQWGDTISTGQSHDDGNTIYFNSSDWECLVRDHVAAIEKVSA